MDRLPKLVSKYLGAQPGLKILIITVLLAVGVYYVYQMFGRKDEGFGNFYNQQNKFTGTNQDYFWNKLNRGLVHNKGLEDDIARVDDALRGVDTQYNVVKRPNMEKYFSVDPLPGIQKEEQKCSGVSEPSQLPAREKDVASGCGWWYMDDMAKTSFGSRGSETGQYDTMLESRNPGGRWVWDLTEAQKLEDIKKCRRIKSCDMVDLVPGKCGYCVPMNTAVPVDGFGVSKYPDDPKYNCGEKTVMKVSQCPKPQPPPPIIKEDGTVIQPPIPRAICDPVNGQLTIECLISLAKGAGLSDQGAIIDVLRGDPNGYYRGSGDNATKFRKANEIVLKDCKILFEPPFIGDGVIDRTSALQYYNKIYQMVTKGATSRCKEAAGFLAAGTDFDPCLYDANQKGPFELYCLQRTFRESRCQPDGTKYPNDANKGEVDAMTWTGVKEFYDSLRAGSDSRNFEVQMDNAKKCLGVTITPKLNECGDKRGCEILWYAWQYDWNWPEVRYTKQLFLGREFSGSIPGFNTGGNDFNPYGRYEQTGFRIRTRLFNPEESRTARLWVQTDDGVALKARGNIILRKWWDQGPTSYESEPFVLEKEKQLPLDLYWFENGGGATFNLKLNKADGSYDGVPDNMLQLAVSTGYPLCRWDFYMSTFDERHGVLSSQPNDLSFGVMGGKKCAVFAKANSAIQVHNPVRGGAFRSFAYMVYVRNIPNYWSRLFSLRKGPSNCDAGYTHGNSSTIEGGICADGRVWMGLKPAGQGWHTWIHSAPIISMNTWVHIAYVYDDDYKGSTIFVNGNQIARHRNDGANGDFHENLECNAVGIGIGHYNWSCNGQPISCGMAWAHWFDYPLTADNAKQDMQLIFTKSSVYPEDPVSGWRAMF